MKNSRLCILFACGLGAFAQEAALNAPILRPYTGQKPALRTYETMTHSGGPILGGATATVYVILCGSQWASPTEAMVNDLFTAPGGAGVHDLNAKFFDGRKTHLVNAVNYTPAVDSASDGYSHVKNLSDAQIQWPTRSTRANFRRTRMACISL